MGTRLEKRSPRAELGKRRGRLESVAERLTNAFIGRLSRAKTNIQQNRQQLQALDVRMVLAVQQQLSLRKNSLGSMAKLLKSYSHEGVLERGFALVLTEKGQPVRGVGMASLGSALTVQVADGRFGVVVAGAKPAKQPGQPAAKTSDSKPQTDLFS